MPPRGLFVTGVISVHVEAQIFTLLVLDDERVVAVERAALVGEEEGGDWLQHTCLQRVEDWLHTDLV